jgi:DNA-directed RNA polymerase specialized sigma24 family protein
MALAVLFPTTCWTQLADASLNGDTAAGQALGGFCERYRTPVIQFLRARGILEDRIEDMAHDFFIHLMQRSSLKGADRERGRFRNFLCGAIQNFLANDTSKNKAAKRGGGIPHISLNDATAEGEELHILTEEEEATLMDRAWALNLVYRALAATECEWNGGQRQARFAVLRAFLPGASQVMSQEQAAAALEIDTGALRSEISRLRAKFREILRREVAATVSHPDDVDDELRYLRSILKKSGASLGPGPHQ